MTTSWEHYKRESDKTLWVHIYQDRSPKSQIAIAINKWWKTRYPTYRMRICTKETFESIKRQS